MLFKLSKRKHWIGEVNLIKQFAWFPQKLNTTIIDGKEITHYVWLQFMYRISHKSFHPNNIWHLSPKSAIACLFNTTVLCYKERIDSYLLEFLRDTYSLDNCNNLLGLDKLYEDEYNTAIDTVTQKLKQQEEQNGSY